MKYWHYYSNCYISNQNAQNYRICLIIQSEIAKSFVYSFYVFMTRVYHESWYPHIINDQIMYIRYVAKCIVSIMTFKEKTEKCFFIYKYLQSQCKRKNSLVFVETPYLGSRSNFCNCYNSARVQFSFIACQIEINLE